MVNNKKIKLLLFAKYGTKGASSRYRSYQYIPYLENQGIQIDINVLFTNKDLNRLYKKGSYGILILIKAFLKRLSKLLFVFKYDLIIIEYELFPYFPPIFEIFLKKSGKKYIVDFDDAIFHNYDMSPNIIVRSLLKKKIIKVIKNATAITAGNQYLYNYASNWNKNINIIPTVVDLSKYIHIEADKNPDFFVIGWIGSPSSSKYLLNLAGVFQKLEKDKFRLKFIGFDQRLKKQFKGIEVEWIEWSEHSEVKEIKSFDVGIMPLEKSPWEMGKCGFKLIQYMACGIPVIASPVGVNNEIVMHGKNGFLAETADDWYNSFLNLYKDKELCAQMGVEGIKTVSEKYSLEKTYPGYLDIITSLTK